MSEIQNIIDMVIKRNNLSDNIRFLCEAFGWRDLAEHDLRFEAIHRYKVENDTDIMTAVKAVDAYVESLMRDLM